MSKQVEIELKVGLFVTIGVMLTMIAILFLGNTGSLFTVQYKYYSYFENIHGLIGGAKVVVGGLRVGAIKEINYDKEQNKIKVEINLEKQYSDWVREDSIVEVGTQGILGDKYLTILPGSPDKPKLKKGSTIPNRSPKGVEQFLSQGDNLIVSINSIAASIDSILKAFESNDRSNRFFDGMSKSAVNMAETTEHLKKLKGSIKNLNDILTKINNGTGTLGALVNDPSLYDDMKSLFGGINHNRIVRNLVRKTVNENNDKNSKAQDKK